MTRFILLALTLALILTACSGLTGQPVSQSEIATRVALLKMTPGSAQPTTGEGVILATVQTDLPELTATATATVTPSPTVQPSDPIAWLGSPTWRDTFSGSNNFYTTADENVQFNYTNDTFNMTALNNQGWHSWSLGNRRIANFYLEATFKVGNCSSNDQYGLVFRAPDTSQGYFYVIRCGGTFGLIRWDTMDQLIDWKPVVPLRSGPNQVNRVGVMARGSELTFYINGEEIQKINNGRYVEGLFGFFIASYGTSGFNVQVEEVSYWNQ
jgi:hypothetical protein